MGVTRAANQALGKTHSDRGFHGLVTAHLGDVVRELFGACATNLSIGNTQVFAEIAPAAATLITCFSTKTPDPASARSQVLGVCDGATEFEGSNRLKAGFALWCDALSEPDPTRRSQLILAGSLELGDHEQHHLQDPIAGSMEMGMNKSFGLLKQRVVADLPGLSAIEEEIDAALSPLGRAASNLWGDLMTELLGTIQTPDGTLRLDHDVPPIAGQDFVPPDLEPVVVDDLAALLRRFNRARDDGQGSRALNWVSLNDRMNFIANLFRSRHHRKELFQAPFAPETLADIESDRIPTHPQPPMPGSGGNGRPPAKVPTRPNVPPSRGVEMFTDEFVDELRMTGDQPADEAVAKFFAETEAEHTELFGRLAASSAGALADEDLPGIASFVKEEEEWPEWADPDLVLAGQSVFGDFGPQLGMGLFMASLPADYAFARGVQALGCTALLTKDPKRRYVETGQMIIDVMMPGALEPGRAGYRAVRHVRLMHAAVRHVLLHLDEIKQAGAPKMAPWDTKLLGRPLNQLQLLGTLFSFSVEGGIEALRKSGVRLNDDRAEAYIHVWNLVGHQIGIRQDLLPLSCEDSRTLWDQRRNLEYGPTDEGKKLTAAAIECMQELFGFTGMPGLPATGIRFYLGNDTADVLGVPKADWTRVIFEIMRWNDCLYGLVLSRFPGTRPIAAELGRRVWKGFEQYGRQGKRPAFQVTDELKRAWGMRI
jgi:hypothetical protein